MIEVRRNALLGNRCKHFRCHYPGSWLFGYTRCKLDAFAERFAQAGVAAFFFDYRNFGDSEIAKGSLAIIEPKRHQVDFYETLTQVKSLSEVYANRVILWGSSLSGGYVITIVGKQPSIAAVNVHVRDVSGIPTMLAMKTSDLLTAIVACLREGRRSFVRGAL